MATNISTGGTGQDFTDQGIWEPTTDIDLVAAGDIEIFRGSTNENFDVANFTMAGATVDSSNYRILDVNIASNKHKGVASTGHARMYRSGAGHVITISEDFVIIKGWDIELFVTCDSSDEGIRISGNIDHTVISRCIVHYAGSVSNTDGIHCFAISGTVTKNTYIDNCIIYGFERGGIQCQMLASGTNTFNLFVDWCSITENGTVGDGDGGIVIDSNGSNTIIATVKNTWSAENLGDGDQDYQARGSATQTWVGSNNIAGEGDPAAFTDSFIDVAVVDTTPGSGDNVHVVDITAKDFTLEGENAFTKTQNGLDTIGSEPEARQDFTTDIADRVRTGAPTFSIGAYQFVLAVTPVIDSLTPDNGSESGGTVVVAAMTDAGAVEGTLTVDGNAATINAWADGEITYITPAGTVGPVDVVATHDNGNPSAAFPFTYTAAPTADGVSPKSGLRVGLSLGL